MAIWLDSFGETLLDASLSATALLSLVAMAMIGCRQPVRRIWLARTAIVSVLVLLPLVIFAPFPRVPVSNVASRTGIFAHPIFAYQPGEPVEDSVFTAERPTDQDPTSQGSRPLDGLLGPPPRWMVVLYLTGTATSLSGLLLGHWGLNLVTSRAQAPSNSTNDLYRSLLVNGRKPRLLVSPRVRSPVLVGVFRQTILIPRELDHPDSIDKLRLSLLHELAHAERLDCLFGFASSLAHSLWYFLPPLWWIRSQMRLDQEFLADRRAAGGFGPFPNYAANLVKIASGSSEWKAMSATSKPNAQTGGSALFQRVLMLIQCPFSVETHPPRWWSYTLPILVLLGTMAASCLTLRVSEVATAVEPIVSKSPAGPQMFRMSRLVVNPPKQPTCQAPQYKLPLRLPQSFDLSLEVWGNSDSLAQTKVVGLPLSEPRPTAVPLDSTMSWHQVRILRTRDLTTLLVDQTPVPIGSNPTLTPSLTFESSVAWPTHFRELKLIW